MRMSWAQNGETGQMAFLPRQWPLDEAGDPRPCSFDRKSAVYSLSSHMLVYLLTVFLSSQQVPIDIHQLWKRMMVETVRSRPGKS